MKKILIIDDSFIMRNWVKKLLKEDGFQFIEANDGKDAIKKMKDNYVDLILLDLLMPKYDGFYFLEQVPEEEAKKVIVLSADIQDSTRTKVLSYGAAGFLNKPPQADMLKNLMEKILS